MSEPLESEGNPTIELGLQHMLSGSAEQFPHSWTAPIASKQTIRGTPVPPPNWNAPWMYVDPPGPNRKIRWQGPDGTIHEQDAPAEQKYIIPGPKPGEMEERRMRAMIREEIQRALYPGGDISAHRHRRVEMTEEDGTRWRGMLYAVEEETADGVCWACRQPGINLVRRGSHLTHAHASECLDAVNKPESEDHKG